MCTPPINRAKRNHIMTIDTLQPVEDFKRPRLKDGDEGYDEFREGQSTEKLSDEGLKRLFKNEEMRSKVSEEEKAEISAEVIGEMEADPYLGWALKKYRALGPVKMEMFKRSALRQPFNGVQIAAFTKMITRLDFTLRDEDTLFNMAFLKQVAANMTSTQRVHFMAKVAESEQAYVVGVMRKTGMATKEEVDQYVAKMAEGYADPVGAQGLYKADVEEVMSDLDALIAQLPADEKTYSYKRADHPKNEMERIYTIQNAALAGGLGVGVMTLIINSAGAFRHLLRGDPDKAWEHIANHPYVPISLLGITGFGRALDKVDRPRSEIVMTGERGRLGELINAGVSLQSIQHLKNEDLFYALQNDFESGSDYEEMRGKPMSEAMPQVYANLESRGLLPKQHQEADMVEDFINFYLLLRKWNYWSYRSYYNFGTYCEKEYAKVRKSEAMRLADGKAERSEAGGLEVT